MVHESGFDPGFNLNKYKYIDDVLAVTIFIVLMVFTAVFFCTYYFFNLTGWSAFTLGVLIGFIILIVVYPPGSLSYQDSNSVVIIYIVICIIVPIYLLIYLFMSLLWTKRDNKLVEWF